METIASLETVIARAVEGKIVFVAVSANHPHPAERLEDVRRQVLALLKPFMLTIRMTQTCFYFISSEGTICFVYGYSEDADWRRGTTWDGGMYV